MSKQLRALLVLTAAIALVASACSSDSSSEESTTTQASAETTTTQAAATTTQAPDTTTTAPPADLELAWYAPAAHPYFEEVLIGVAAFEADFGIEVEQQIGPDWEQASQNERVEALAAQGISLISIYPADAGGANGLYEELTAAGVTFVNFGASTSQPTTATFVVATDVKEAAKQATQALIASMGGKGKIINVLEVLEDANTVLRKEGVEEVVAENPDVEIIQEVAGIQTVEEALEKVGAALAANIAEVDGILATGFTPSVGIATLLDEYYATGGDREIHAVGIDTDPIVVEAIENGIMDGTIAQNPFGHGYLSLLALKLIGEGWTPIEGVYHIDSGAVFVTIDNLDTYADDIAAVTEKIKGDLTSVYLIAP